MICFEFNFENNVLSKLFRTESSFRSFCSLQRCFFLAIPACLPYVRDNIEYKTSPHPSLLLLPAPHFNDYYWQSSQRSACQKYLAETSPKKFPTVWFNFLFSLAIHQKDIFSYFDRNRQLGEMVGDWNGVSFRLMNSRTGWDSTELRMKMSWNY
jgi:hypothetical protein